MKSIIDITLVAIITIYIVDISGFTETWLQFLSAYKGKRITELKPFSCSLCMVWWVCVIYIIAAGVFSLPLVAWVAFLSMMSAPIGQLLILVREGMGKAVDKLMELWRI